MTDNQTVAFLKDAVQKKQVPAFIERLVELLVGDHNKWLSISREQRLIEGFRSKAVIDHIASELSKRLEGAISSTALLAVTKHTAFCAVAQNIFDYIDSETKVISSEQLSSDYFHQFVISISELASERSRRMVASQVADFTEPPPIHTFVQASSELRNVADVCLTLLYSPSPRRVQESKTTLTNGQENRLIELAFMYNDVRSACDSYTYGRCEISIIDERSVEFINLDPSRDAVTQVASERNASADHHRSVLINFITQEVERNISEPTDDSSFSEYLLKCRPIYPLLERLALAVQNDITDEVSPYLESTALLPTRYGEFTLDEVIACWSTLRALSGAVSYWQNGRAWDAVLGNPVPIVHRGVIIQAISMHLKCSLLKARRLYRQMSFDGKKKSTDLFFKPLIPMRDTSWVILGSRFIEASRFERNIFTLLVAEKLLDQDAKGFKPIFALVGDFRRAGFLVLNDVPADGPVSTDVDLVAFREGHLFLCQAKIVIDPDTQYEVWKAEQRLDHAARQLETSIANVASVLSTLKVKYPEVMIKVETITPFILTNTRQFTDLEIGGFPVVDLAYIRFLLDGATVAVLLTQENEMAMGSGESFISGEFPSGAELRSLIMNTVHGTRSRFKSVSHKDLKVGDFTIRRPTTTLHPSKHPFMKIMKETDWA